MNIKLHREFFSQNFMWMIFTREKLQQDRITFTCFVNKLYDYKDLSALCAAKQVPTVGAAL